MSDSKPQFTSDYQDSHDQHSDFESCDIAQNKTRGAARLAESARLGLTLLSLLAGVTILGTSGDTLSVYNTTSLTTDFRLSPWPKEFDIRPTIALVSCGAVIFIIGTLSLIAGKTQSIRNNILLHSIAAFGAPTLCLIAGLIGTSFYYGVNTSSTQYSLQAWSCRWSPIDMDTKPHWSTLCKESKTGLYLSVMIIPLEILILGTAVFGARFEKKNLVARELKGSPAMS